MPQLEKNGFFLDLFGGNYTPPSNQAHFFNAFCPPQKKN